ncbi:hypothetical protein [Clostridium kluyveri]|uniref:hypothetical protein n=1 Tax=Clostridium kluyveri TaxID=1534 RepID=UPI002246680B|nr:hypothetical protein [Clostridium kluyveri]UZQ51215.1 hypothetical protein OP486_03295 [Clostridium kluyveri]
MKKAKFLSGVLASALILSSTAVFAADNQKQSQGDGITAAQQASSSSLQLTEKLNTRIEEAVSLGKITQEQADKIKERLSSSQTKSKLQASFNGDMGKLTERLDTAVKEGKITQEQVDKILAKLNQRKADVKSKIDAAVKSGKITQEQANNFLNN